MSTQQVDIENLWKGVSLEKLRDVFKKIDGLTKRFENALAALLKCDPCARVSLLEQIHSTGKELGGEVVFIISLSDSLKNAVATAEKMHEELLKNCPSPCRCSEGGECPSHQ